MARYRNYSDDDKAQALAFLAANRNNYRLAARHTGIPWTTLREWHFGVGVNEPVSELRTQKAATLRDMWEEEANAALGLAKSRRMDATYSQLVSAAGIATDKACLLDKMASEAAPLSDEEAEAEALAYIGERGYSVVSGPAEGEPGEGAAAAPGGAADDLPDE
jgi:transposase-like protein